MSDEPQKKSRPRLSPMMIAGIVLAVAAVIAIVAGAAIARRGSGNPTPGSDQPHQGTSETSGLPALANDAGVPPTSTAGSGNAPASVNGGGASPSNPSLAVRPTAPVPKGSKVTSISAPPTQTVGMLVVPKGFKGAQYAVTFRPYGWGPGGAAGGRLVIRIDTSKAVDAGAKAYGKDFSGRNAIAFVVPSAAAAIKLGGTYTGQLLLRPQADVGVFYLLKATPKK